MPGFAVLTRLLPNIDACDGRGQLARSPQEVSMATKTIEAELLDLEKRYWQAIQDQDVDVAIRLTDEPCIVTGAQGIGLIDRKTLAAMMKAANYTLKRFELMDGAQVRLL
jgi:hypothetical protein